MSPNGEKIKPIAGCEVASFWENILNDTVLLFVFVVDILSTFQKDKAHGDVYKRQLVF